MSRRRAGKYPGLPPSPETAAADVSRDNLKNELSAGIERQIDKLCAAPLAPGLHVVSTPIGNLVRYNPSRALHARGRGYRAVARTPATAASSSQPIGIGRKLETYHDFSSERDRERILGALRDGKSVALISDAGTPLVADPGFKLVRAALAEGSAFFRFRAPRRCYRRLSQAASHPIGFSSADSSRRRRRRDGRRWRRSATRPGTLIFYEIGLRGSKRR